MRARRGRYPRARERLGRPRPQRYLRAHMRALRETMDAIEQRFEGERELRRLMRAAEHDERLTDDERRIAVERCAFYLGDLHRRAREAERIARGPDLLPLQS